MRLPTERKEKRINKNREKSKNRENKDSIKKEVDIKLCSDSKGINSKEAKLDGSSITMGIIDNTKVMSLVADDCTYRISGGWEELVIYLISYGLDKYGNERFINLLVQAGLMQSDTFSISRMNDDIVRPDIQKLKAKGLYKKYRVYDSGYYLRMTVDSYSLAVRIVKLTNICFSNKQNVYIEVVNENYVEKESIINNSEYITKNIEELIRMRMEQLSKLTE